jgi:hypothetical protein
MKIVKDCKTPETVIICGAWVNNKEPSVKVTDDESGISIRKFDGTYEHLHGYGHIYILNEDEFNEFLNSEHYQNKYGHDEWAEKENYYVILKDYVGTIGVTAELTSEGFKESDDWDINDYFYHQPIADDDNGNLIMDVSGEYEFESTNLIEVNKILNSDKSTKTSEILSENDKGCIYASLVVQGLGRWIQHDGGYIEDGDAELKELSLRAKTAMDKVEKRLIALGINVNKILQK